MRAAWVAVIWAIGLGGAGCVEDDAADGATPATTIRIESTEFEFDPDSWTVPAGEEVTVELDNGGAVAHEWVVIRQGDEVSSGADFDEGDVLFEVEAVDPGDTGRGTFTFDQPGSHQVICGVPGHFDAGMAGELAVR